MVKKILSLSLITLFLFQAVHFNVCTSYAWSFGNKEPEILATNLTPEEFSTEDLKELYAKRWTVETGFDRLKNLIEIEDFSGTQRKIIEQDFYAHIFVYNLAIIKNHV